MAFNPHVINTSMPPPNFPGVPMQFSAHQANPCPTPPPTQQHMFNTGMHVPPPNPSPFNAVSSHHLPSPGFTPNPMQAPSPMWNNNPLNSTTANNQNRNFHNAPPPVPFAQNTQLTGSFQASPPVPGKQFQNSGWSNSINNVPNSNIGLLAIAPNSSNNNQQNFNNPVPIGPNFQSSTPQFNSNNDRSNVPVWSNNNFSHNESLRPPQNQMLVNGNQNRFNPNKDSNAFSHKNTWNSIQKTNVPDSNIFQNPNAILSITGNNYEVLNPPANGVAEKNFQNYNAPKFPMKQPDMIPLNQGRNFASSYENNNASVNGDSDTNYNKSSFKHNRNFGNSKEFNNKHGKGFQKTGKQDNIQNNNFRFVKSGYNEGQNIQSFHHNQNLIDICVVPNKNNFEVKPTNCKFSGSNSYCRSNSNSTAVEEFTISDSESVESINSKSSPKKFTRNNRIHENLQKVNSESNENNFQNKMVWMTDSIQKALQKRNRLFKQARTTNDQAVWNEYNKLKNEINEEIKRSKLNAKNNRPKRPKVWQDKGKKLPFNCDTCDRGFPSKDELDVHTALHIKCHHWGCNFEAHPKIVSLHQRMQHDTGYADVINKLQNDEEIKKWREERKRRFPTAENILKKKAEQAEKEARGEVIEEKNYGQFKKRKFEDRNKDRSSNRQNRNNRKRRPRNAFQKAPEIDLAQDSDSEDESECPTKLRKFQGMKMGLEDLLINNDVKIEDTANVKVEEADDRFSSLTSEVSSCQTVPFSNHRELDDDDDAPLEIPIQKASLNESSDSADENDSKSLEKVIQQESLNEVAEEISASPNIEEKLDSNVKSSLVSKNDKGNKRERNEKRCRPPVPPRPRHSLLQMLLSDEIRHERNVIMQCVRHIVRNKFFGIGAST